MDEVDAIIEEREKTHGSYPRQSHIAQQLKDVLRSGDSYAQLTEGQLEALDMICTKQARIVSGDPQIPEHWDDMSGYSRLGKDSIRKEA